ncbi:EAL domain-containing protein [Synechococcales cyanobacterium C]|uniref:EAL domain-containing protein n=1 Tax=Petrachloros mirabilis ULC683 TaxID=2781853 RepID=A0A8K2A5Z1_9CYAN|nr:bifunctional diguanylate cyclase/phosphodiesterase [Petrachloros mirabilis]NCJ04959.1 EAL domain-containing protein [Petrachloros mirabilis ULC683]
MIVWVGFGVGISIIIGLVYGLRRIHRQHIQSLQTRLDQTQAELTQANQTRTQLQAALDQSHQQITTLISNLPGYFYIVENDQDYTPTLTSEGAYDLTGYRQDEYLHSRTISCGQEIHPEDQDRVWAQVQTAIAQQQPYECTYRIHTQTGATRWAWERGRGVFDTSGRLLYLSGVVTDITELTQAQESIQQLGMAVENAMTGISKLDLEWRFVMVREGYAHMLGYEPAEMLGQSWTDTVLPEDHPLGEQAFRRMQQAGRAEQDLRALCKDGSIFDKQVLLVQTQDAQGQPNGHYCFMRDISDRKQAEAALRQSELTNRALIQAIPDILLRIKLDGTCVDMKRVQEFDTSPLNHDRYCTLLPLDETSEHRSHIQRALDTQSMQIYEYQYEVEGNLHEAEARIVVLSQDEVLVMIRDITQRKQTELHLVHAAYHDDLTHLPNRALFLNRVEQALAKIQSFSDYQFAILFADLDHFKVINDSLGHLVGDHLLIEVARVLQHCVRGMDTVARLGGDEFTILLDGVSGVEDATRIADRIRDALQHPFLIEGHSIFTNVSIGILLSSQAYGQPEELLRDADIALYRAKEQGRSRYAVFDQTMYAQACDRLRLENELRQALELQELQLYYQPIISLKHHKLVGFEALLRWEHPQQGIIPASEFIPIAEESGMIIPIGQWVLETACRQMLAWRSQFPTAAEILMSVNISAQQLLEPGLLETVMQLLATCSYQQPMLKLEITESLFLQSTETTKQLFAQTQRQPLYLSLDDFGTGYSSMSYLHQFPVHELKIDRSFISQMQAGCKNLEIVRAILAMAHALGIEVVAEGVENPEQAKQLQDLGCEFAQGFLFSPPLDALSAEALLVVQRQFKWQSPSER